MDHDAIFRIVLRDDGWAIVIRISPHSDAEVTLRDQMTEPMAQFIYDHIGLAFQNWSDIYGSDHV